MSTIIHPTAVVDASAEIADGVAIGPHAVVEADCVIGPGCTIMYGAVIRRWTHMGQDNVVHPYSVLGGEPQDLKFYPSTRTFLRIGDRNTFREHTSFHRASKPGQATVVGSDCYFMVGSHAGHDAIIHNRAVMVNNAAMAGHSELGAGAVLSGCVMVHQFCWVGEGVMTRGHSGLSQHLPPYCMLNRINEVTGLNVVGLRRMDVPPEQRLQVKAAYHLLYRSGLTPAAALIEMDRHAEWGAPAVKFRDFVRRVLAAKKPYNRGLARDRSAGAHASADDAQ